MGRNMANEVSKWPFSLTVPAPQSLAPASDSSCVKTPDSVLSGISRRCQACLGSGSRTQNKLSHPEFTLYSMSGVPLSATTQRRPSWPALCMNSHLAST